MVQHTASKGIAAGQRNIGNFVNKTPVATYQRDLRGIAASRASSVATVNNWKQHLGFAFFYNALGVPLAAGLLYPFAGWLLPPMIATLAMSLSSASLITNALRLRSNYV